ncbi:CS012 protein, partial [Picathartes gymnocephalus]|nr:CS012 protein [Picathartes gymnocephalus]
MPIRVGDVMTLLSHLAEVEGMRATVTHSVRGALLTGGSAFVGAVMGGPPGFAVGGAVGGAIAWLTSEPFQSVPQILMRLPETEKQKLCAEAMAVIRNLHWTDAAQLVGLVMANPTLKGRVLGVLTNYLTNELRAQIRYGE